MKHHHPARKWTLFALRWGVAVVGIWYVLANISWRDRALILGPRNVPVEVRLYDRADEGAPSVSILDPETLRPREVPWAQLVHESDRNQVTIQTEQGPATLPLLAVDLTPNLRQAERLLVAEPSTGEGRWVPAARAVGGFEVRVPYPLIQPGLGQMIKDAEPLYLWAAVLIFPVTFLICSMRWHLLLTALGIRLGFARSFVITMVGAFYNTFMPGSTGGDVLKAYYAAKQAPDKRTRAVISVIIDRVIGLLALIMMGGIAAATQWDEPACRQVALGAAAALALVVAGLWVFYHPRLRRWTGVDFVLRKLPLQRQVQKAVDAMEVYRQRPGLVFVTLVATFPVHITVVLSAMLCGLAFDLPRMPYFVIVPVVVLAGAIPISPQGAGVMEFFAILLTRRYGATVSEAFALTMSIRAVQILWNLAGGLFVLRGGYGAPTRAEEEAVLADEAGGAAAGPEAAPDTSPRGPEGGAPVSATPA